MKFILKVTIFSHSRDGELLYNFSFFDGKTSVEEYYKIYKKNEYSKLLNDYNMLIEQEFENDDITIELSRYDIQYLNNEYYFDPKINKSHLYQIEDYLHLDTITFH